MQVLARILPRADRCLIEGQVRNLELIFVDWVRDAAALVLSNHFGRAVLHLLLWVDAEILLLVVGLVRLGLRVFLADGAYNFRDLLSLNL